jgi:hypothetical protein
MKEKIQKLKTKNEEISSEKIQKLETKMKIIHQIKKISSKKRTIKNFFTST